MGDGKGAGIASKTGAARGRKKKREKDTEEGESRVVMACLDIDPGFRDVTTVPQLSTLYTLALVCAHL